MNRKIFMFERRPTYQEDPSFYAERVVGTVSNVFKRTYTSNQTEKVDGQFTGVDITVNVVPVCDRIRRSGDSGSGVMISSLSVGTGSSVSLANNYVFVYIREYDVYYTVVVQSN